MVKTKMVDENSPPEARLAVMRAQQLVGINNPKKIMGCMDDL